MISTTNNNNKKNLKKIMKNKNSNNSRLIKKKIKTFIHKRAQFSKTIAVNKIVNKIDKVQESHKIFRKYSLREMDQLKTFKIWIV